jgi:LmbE family N-acetylglucosaminyl deacetylase
MKSILRCLAALAVLALALLLVPAAPAAVNLGPSAYEPATTGALPTLDRALAKLSTHRRLLLIGAHPDDEDTSLLALVSRGWGGEAAYLSLSRGEGGQNLLGPELGVGLGLIRSRELLAARAVDGGRQFFSRAFDFGFTMSVERTLGLWPKAALVEDTVRIIRRFKPQIVVSVFPGTPVRTHGQHQAAGLAAYAAFPLAGDPAALPQLRAEGLAPWAPQVLYRSTYFDPDASTLTLPTSRIDPLSGKSDFQIAMASRGMHRSQSMGRIQELGPKETRVAWVAGGTGGPAKDLFAGIDTHLRGIAAALADSGLRRRVGDQLEAVEQLAERTRAALSPERLDGAVPALAEIVRRLGEARGWVQGAGGRAEDQPVAELIAEKLEVAEIALAAAAGIALDAATEHEALTPGEAFQVAAQVWNSSREPLAGASVSLVPAPEWQGGAVAGEARPLPPGELGKWTLQATVPAAAPPTQPYFLRRPLQGSLYDWSDAAPAERGEPFGPPPLTARFRFTLAGAEVTVDREVVHRHGDEVLGEVRRPLRVVPRLEAAVADSVVVWPLARREPRNLRVILTSHVRMPLAGRLEVTPENLPAGAQPAGSAGSGGSGGSAGSPGSSAWPAPAPVRFELAAGEEEGESVSLPLTLAPPPAAGRFRLRLAAVVDGGESHDLAVPLIDYEHIRPTPSPRRATLDITVADIRVPRQKHVGYVLGVSDRVPDFLRQVGIPVELLGAADLAGGHLERYDAIVVGSRAYESDPGLARANPRLLDYVRAGGLLIVQYQQYPFIQGGFAPYKLEMARPHDRITEETAPVILLDPAHPAFNSPNKISDADWQGWVQERGLYFAHSWDPAYQPLLAMADRGGPEQRGGLLVAALGKGRYVYTGLSFFRQLPAGVPGAYRLFANLLALPR